MHIDTNTVQKIIAGISFFALLLFFLILLPQNAPVFSICQRELDTLAGGCRIALVQGIPVCQTTGGTRTTYTTDGCSGSGATCTGSGLGTINSAACLKNKCDTLGAVPYISYCRDTAPGGGPPPPPKSCAPEGQNVFDSRYNGTCCFGTSPNFLGVCSKGCAPEGQFAWNPVYNGSCCGGLIQGFGGLCVKSCTPEGRSTTDGAYTGQCCSGTFKNASSVCEACSAPTRPYSLEPDLVCPGLHNYSWRGSWGTSRGNFKFRANAPGQSAVSTCGTPRGTDHKAGECNDNVTQFFLPGVAYYRYLFNRGESYYWWVISENACGQATAATAHTTKTVDPTKPPQALSPQGDIPPGTRPITWSAPTQPNLVTQYAVRIEDQNDGTGNGQGVASVCGKTQGKDHKGDECFSTTATSWSYTFETGHTYLVWVHGASCNVYGDSRSVTITVKDPLASVTIQGALREYKGASCSTGISSSTLNTITVRPQNAQGVTATCTINPQTGTTKTSYSCTVNSNVFQGAPCSNTLTLSARPAEYQPGYLVDQNACQATGNNTIAINLCGANPQTTFDKDFLFQPPGPWVKLKNSSFAGGGRLSNPIPLAITAYDADDDAAQRVFIVAGAGSDPGVVTATSVNTGTAQVSNNGWARANYETTPNLPPKSYREYIKTRKDYTTISRLSELEPDKVHFWQDKSVPVVLTATTDFDGKNVVVVTEGEIQVNADFKPTSAVALVGGTITFGDTVKEAKGIFVADTINTGTNTAQGLKIIGNLNAKTNFVNNRELTDNSKPSVFIVFDPELFITLLPSLSTAKYEYQQKQ